MSYVFLARTTRPTASTLSVATKLGLKRFNAAFVESKTLTSSWSRNNYSIPRAFSSTPDAIVTPVDNRDRTTSFATLRALDKDVVRKIQAELKGVDANSDGRIDAEELKQLLHKHHSAFTDDEVVEIGELFYASKAGESVSIESFIQAIENATSHADAVEHNRTSGRHPLGVGRCSSEFMYAKTHGKYTKEDLDIHLTHVKPEGIRDQIALAAVKAVRFVFDTATGWKQGNITPERILNRVIFLETVAAVPGMVAAGVAHFKSLRQMQRNDRILMFLEEATNERMHLLTFVKLKDPSTMFRMAVIGGQFGFGSLFLLSYMISPKFCHRFVGYIEEEACSTYTKIIHEIEAAPEGSELANWRKQVAPKLARSYWKMGEKCTILDLMYAVRADEAEHRDVNHLVTDLKEGESNPITDPAVKLDKVLVKYVKDLMEREPKQAATP